MKNFLHLMLSASLVVLLFSCSSKPREVVVEDKFKMQIPGNLASTTVLNEEATLQYMNVFKELYLMVLEDTPEELAMAIEGYELPYSNDFDGFCQLLCSGEEESFVMEGDYEKLENITINGLEARIFSNRRTVNGLDVYYKQVFVNGKKAYYQVITWTLPDRKETFDETMTEMINSFEEITE